MPKLAVMSDYSRRQNNQSSQGSTDSGLSDMQFDQEMGNTAAQDLLKVQGNLGRAFNRIVGVSESNTNAVGLAFSRDDLKAYIQDQLKFAEGEWFSGTKVSGATDEIMSRLDADRDGRVDWFEFQAMVTQLKMTLLDGIGPGAGNAEIQAEANKVFAEISGGSGAVGFEQLEWQTAQNLPEETENRDLIAQLIALLIIDIVDVDEANKAVRDRTVSEDEWVGAVSGMVGV